MILLLVAEKFKFQRFPEPTDASPVPAEEDARKGLLQMDVAEGVKLQMCYVLHHLNDIQLRHRVEAIVAFSHDYIGEVQAVRHNLIAYSLRVDAKSRALNLGPIETLY